MNKLASISKKYIVLVSIICSLFIFGHQVIAQNDPTVVVPPVITTDPTPVIGSYKGNCNPTTDENCYQFLEALPTSEGDLTSVNTSATGKEGKGLGGFITFAFEIGVGVAGVLGVVMLTIYGFQYAANDKNIATFEILKEKITKVILGLLLLLGIFVILNTINPDLLIVEPGVGDVSFVIKNAVDIGFQASETEDASQAVSLDYGNIKYNKNNSCPGIGNPPNTTCIKIFGPSFIQSKGKYLEVGFANKLNNFATSLNNSGIKTRIKEAWPPSRVHKAYCHSVGTCVDITHATSLGTRKVPTPLEVKAFVEAAKNNGLCAVYEVKSESERSSILAAGVPAKNIKNYGSWISASHYSLYGAGCK